MIGKEKCRILKEIRQKIADENDIAYVTRECTYQGDCRGTCPKCESELRYLEKQLAARAAAGKRIAIAALCAGMTFSMGGCSAIPNNKGKENVEDLAGAAEPMPEPDEVVLKLLDLGENSSDLWSDLTNNFRTIDEERSLFALAAAHRQIKDVESTEKGLKKAAKALKEYMKSHPDYRFVQGSRNELYRWNENELQILFYHDRDTDMKQLIGQAALYRFYIDLYSREEIPLKFSVSDSDPTVEYHINASR